MKKLLTFLLLSISGYSFAQVSVVNADSVRLGNPAGSGGVSLHGKTYLKNMTEGSPQDSVLVRAANGQIKSIKQGAATSAAVAGIPFSDSDDLSAASNPGKLIYNTTLQKLRIYDPITSTWKDVNPADLSNFYTKSEVDALVSNTQVPGLQAVTDKSNTTTTRVYALGGLTTNGYHVIGDILGYNTMSSAKQSYTQSPDGTRFTWIETHPSPNVGDASTTYAINWRKKSGTVAFLDDISGTQTPTLQNVTTAGNTTTTGATFGGNIESVNGNKKAILGPGGLEINTNGSRSAILKADKIYTEQRTFQLPNVSGTLALEGFYLNTHDNVLDLSTYPTKGVYTFYGSSDTFWSLPFRYQSSGFEYTFINMGTASIYIDGKGQDGQIFWKDGVGSYQLIVQPNEIIKIFNNDMKFVVIK